LVNAEMERILSDPTLKDLFWKKVSVPLSNFPWGLRLTG
jgi:hypothetical protein